MTKTDHQAQSQANALAARAQAARLRGGQSAKQQTPEVDWDKAITLLRKTLRKVYR